MSLMWWNWASRSACWAPSFRLDVPGGYSPSRGAALARWSVRRRIPWPAACRPAGRSTWRSSAAGTWDRPCLGRDEVVQLQEQIRVLVDAPLAAAALTTDPSRIRRLSSFDLTSPGEHGVPARVCHPGHRSRPATTKHAGNRPCGHPSLPFIEQCCRCCEELGQSALGALHADTVDRATDLCVALTRQCRSWEPYALPRSSRSKLLERRRLTALELDLPGDSRTTHSHFWHIESIPPVQVVQTSVG